MPPSLLDHRLIITVNRRLARALTQQYSAQQINAGEQIWESPEILPWSSWLNQLWRSQLHQSDVTQLLLSPLQSRVIWEGIIRFSAHANGLLQVAETTRVAMAAWRLLHDQDLSFDQIKPLLSEHSIDTQAFADWASAYQERLNYKKWLDSDQLESKLILRFESGQQALPKKFLLAGFNEFTPRQQRFINLLISKGCSIETYTTDMPRAKATRIGCIDAEAELRLVAAQIRFQLEQDPNKKIAVVVPNIQQQKSRIEAVFNEYLSGSTSRLATKQQRPFNISLGDPLSSFALIKAAFTSLTMAHQRLPLEELSRLIRSPFIDAAETEMNQRCLLDARLRSFADDSLGLNLLIKEAACADDQTDNLATEEPDKPAWHCPILARILRQMKALTEEAELTNKRTLVGWIKLFDTLLITLGWPGQRTLNSDEHQTKEAWRGLCEQCISLETVSKEMSYSAALSHLRKIASDTTFQAESSAVPVQVMGLLETSGLQFDQLFVIGMTDAVWPAKAAPNPFLPLALQRTEKMPHASAEVELIFARRITDQLLKTAPLLRFSYALKEGDQTLRPSPLIKALQQINEDDLELSLLPNYRRQIRTETQLEQLYDNQAAALGEQINWSGGVGIFKDQAACPFRAFVRHRLKSEPLALAESGLNPAERGSLIHAALEILWLKIKSQSRLKQLSEMEIKTVITDSVANALEDLHSSKAIVQSAPFRLLETQRLEQLLAEWLRLEAEREANFSVIACEQEMELSLGGLQIKTRIDRIDQLDNGEQVLIDYKAGNIGIKSWQGDRPDEPQLPLYATNMAQTPEAVLFAKLKKGEQAYIGLSNDLGLGNDSEDWPQQLLDWRTVLEDLAAQFVRGDALVDPKETASCQYCNYDSLCRIDEVREFNDTERGDDNE